MNSQIVEWGVAAKQMEGETISGDLHLVKPSDNGALVAVADGLGHGKAAAKAAELALDTAGQCMHEPLIRVLEYCHQKLRQTRGVVMSLAFLNALDNTMTWAGVGNVEGLLVRSSPDGEPDHEYLGLSAGVVGVRLPSLRAVVLRVASGDTLVFVTDGIRRGFEERMVLFDSPGKTAQDILARDCLGTDDALVLVATYKGTPR